MRMAWWLFMAMLSIQIIFLQYMVEVFLAQHYEELVYYLGALGFTFLFTVLMYVFFKKTDKVSEE